MSSKSLHRKTSTIRFFFVPARAEAAVQLGEHCAHGNVAMTERDHEVIDDVRGLRRDAIVRLAGDGARELVRFFAKLVADARGAAFVEALRVALLFGARLSRLEHGLEP